MIDFILPKAKGLEMFNRNLAALKLLMSTKNNLAKQVRNYSNVVFLFKSLMIHLSIFLLRFGKVSPKWITSLLTKESSLRVF